MFYNYNNVDSLPHRKVNDSKENVVCIDQFDAADFNTNEAGHIRNDISALARATSQSQYDAIMKKLVELKQDGGIPEGTTTEEAIAMIKPRWAQSPNEIEQFIAMTNGNVMEKVNKAYEAALKDVKVGDAKEPAPEPATQS